MKNLSIECKNLILELSEKIKGSFKEIENLYFANETEKALRLQVKRARIIGKNALLKSLVKKLDSSTCVNCKSWGHIQNSDFGHCDSEKICLSLNLKEIDSAAYESEEGDHVDFVTGKNFGCVHFND